MQLKQWEREEGTFLEKEWGERLEVSFYALDDSGLHAFGNCIWIPRRYDPVFYVPKYDSVIVYKNSYSWATRHIVHRGEILVAMCNPVMVEGCEMVPIEGGGSIPLEFVRAATREDLGLNPTLQVYDIDAKAVHKMKRISKSGINLGHTAVFLHLLAWKYGFLSESSHFTDDGLVQACHEAGFKGERESVMNEFAGPDHQLVQESIPAAAVQLYLSRVLVIAVFGLVEMIASQVLPSKSVCLPLAYGVARLASACLPWGHGPGCRAATAAVVTVFVVRSMSVLWGAFVCMFFGSICPEFLLLWPRPKKTDD